MLSLTLARQLKAAGLTWTPRLHDFFAIPDRQLDGHVFVISDITVFVEQLLGYPVVTFHGTPEWALDYVMLTELVWLPTEEQLREALEERLAVRRGSRQAGEPQPRLSFSTTENGYRCKIQYRGQELTFESLGASETWATALLYVLQSETRRPNVQGA